MWQPEILILAAGASSRMRGTDKLLQPVGDSTLLTHVARQALLTGLPVTVALPVRDTLRKKSLDGLHLTIVPVQDPGLGLSESLKSGLRSIDPDTGVMLLLGDLPDLTADDLLTMLVDWRTDPDMILRGAAADGTPGHPVCLPAWLRPELAAIAGDTGARDLLRRHLDRTRLIRLPDRHAITDLDTPEDWAAWRASRQE